MADDLILDDAAALVAADSMQMLLATASSGAQVRLGLESIDRDAIGRLAVDGRPRAVVACGMGGSGISGAALAALAAPRSSVPVLALNEYGLPGWVSAVDTVLAISCSGETEETLASAAEAARRGCRLVGIGTAGSALHQLVSATPGSEFLAVDAQGRMPRASLWTLLTPVVIAAEALGVLSGSEVALPHAADRLDEIAVTSGLEVPLEVNAAKTLGLALAESLPMVWGSGELGPVAAVRLACQINENAKRAVVPGRLPESHHNQVVAFEGDGGDDVDLDDLFRDRVLDPDPAARLRLVLLRDDEEHPRVSRRAELSVALAERRGIPVSQVRARPGNPLVRFADLVGVVDWASVYAALSLGVDPGPIAPINELKELLGRDSSGLVES